MLIAIAVCAGALPAFILFVSSNNPDYVARID